MVVTTTTGTRKRVANLTDQEIDAIAWREAEQSVNRAIHEHNQSLPIEKARRGHAQ